jgi:hypothetical protein
MKYLCIAALFIISTSVFAQSEKKDIEIIKSQTGNVITYYAKNMLRERMVVELSVDGTGFTSSAELPVKVEVKGFEKKELTKITMTTTASSYSIGVKHYRAGLTPAPAPQSGN